MNDLKIVKKYCCPAWYFKEYQVFCIKSREKKEYYECPYFNRRNNCWVKYKNLKRFEIIDNYSVKFSKSCYTYSFFKEELIKMITEIFKMYREIG